MERASGSLLVVDRSERAAIGRVTGLGDLSHASVVFSPDERFAHVFGRDGGLSKVDLLTLSVARRVIQAGNGIHDRDRRSGLLPAWPRIQPYVWADAFLGPTRDTIHVIDKASLEIVADLTPVPGAAAAHVEFDRSGRHALVSVWEDDGALVVYDAATLREVKRLPMRKPSGEYNVWNKITFSDGTSH